MSKTAKINCKCTQNNAFQKQRRTHEVESRAFQNNVRALNGFLLDTFFLFLLIFDCPDFYKPNATIKNKKLEKII